MGWSVGWNEDLKRDIGYGVPAVCDHPDCEKKIDRGFTHVCGNPPYGQGGCGLHFCNEHLEYAPGHEPPEMFVRPPGAEPFGKEDIETLLTEAMKIRVQLCERCRADLPPFEMKPDCEEWIQWKMQDESWAEWRKSQGFEEGGTQPATT